MEILAWLEATALSVWIREAPTIFAYPTILACHTVGLGVLVGANVVVSLRLLGFARGIPIGALTSLFGAMWVGFALNAASGALLFAADATTRGTQPIFFVKLGFIVCGVVSVVLLRSSLAGDGRRASPRDRLLAWSSLVIWAGAITTGRLMAYL
jgi:hypothetical protein